MLRCRGAFRPPLSSLVTRHTFICTFRFQQVNPKVIFSVDETVYNAKVHPHLPKLAALLSGLVQDIPPVVVVVSALGKKTDHAEAGWMSWEGFLGEEALAGEKEISWFRGPFDWPLWILFSSGTTSEWCPPLPLSHTVEL